MDVEVTQSSQKLSDHFFCDDSMKTTIVLCIALFAMSSQSHSQNLSSHKWVDRLILILNEDTTNSTFQDQIEELYSDQRAFENRKLVIYTVLPDKFKRDDRDNQGWVESDELYSEYKNNANSFEILLIGLMSIQPSKVG